MEESLATDKSYFTNTFTAESELPHPHISSALTNTQLWSGQQHGLHYHYTPFCPPILRLFSSGWCMHIHTHLPHNWPLPAGVALPLTWTERKGGGGEGLDKEREQDRKRWGLSWHIPQSDQISSIMKPFLTLISTNYLHSLTHVNSLSSLTVCKMLKWQSIIIRRW